MGDIMGLFGRKQPVEPQPMQFLDLDQLKAALGIPATVNLYDGDGLWNIKLQSCTIPPQPRTWTPCTLIRAERVAHCIVNGVWIGDTHPRAVGSMITACMAYGGNAAPGFLRLSTPAAVLVDLRHYAPAMRKDDDDDDDDD